MNINNINDSNILLSNIDNIHTTKMGVDRIKKNICLDSNYDVVKYCIDKIKDNKSNITRKGKNWYIEIDDIVITVNAYSYTIITAHKIRNKMNRNEIFKYVKEKYNTNPEFTWNKFPLYAVLKHEDNKWYGIVMNVSKEKLGLEGKEEIDILDVKCDPELIGSLRFKKGILPAYHMNKEHWISILLDGSISSKEIKQLIDLSYELTITSK